MQNKSVIHIARVLQLLCVFFCIIFFATGVLNVWLVHIVPGIFYLVLSIFYVPHTNTVLQKKFGFKIPLWVLVVAGLVVLWGTLAVGDLAEILGL